MAALGLLAAPWAPDAAWANDFGGLPPSTAKSTLGLKRNGVTAAPSESGLGLFVDKDGSSLLRLALPDADVRAREVQTNLELVKLRLDQVGFSGKTPIWNAAAADASRAEGGLNKHFDEFVSEVAPNQQARAAELLEAVRPQLTLLKAAVKEQNYPATSAAQFAAAEDFAAVRELMVTHAAAQAPGSFFPVPSEYKALPRLEGRARVALTLAPKGGGPATTLVVVVDGYHAPLAAGAFVAQAAAGALDGTPIAYAEELIVGMARPKNTAAAPLPVPLELFYRGDGEPTYGINQDDDGRGSATQVLPFQAYGALGLSHPDEDIDGGAGGQFFFVKYDQGLMPPGRNTLDGAYTCFGYTVEGSDFLKTATPGDKIVKAEVLGGLVNLKAGQK